MNTSTIRRMSRLTILLGLGCISSTVFADALNTPPPGAPLEERMELEPILSSLVHNHIAKEERLPGQQPYVVPKVWYSEEGRVLNVELGKAYLPTDYTISFEERMIAIADLLYIYTEKRTPIYKVDLWFDGKNVYDYFPEERGPAERVDTESRSDARRRSKRVAGGGRVMVAAGHGIYYNSKYKDWRPQRGPSNSILEDMITPTFAGFLQTYMTERSGVEVIRARPPRLAVHAESGRRWGAIAARYHIKDAVPELPAIWSSAGKRSSEGLEERDQDIRSRPLYANHLGVDTLFHLHTNAHADSSVRGIRAFHHPKSPESKRLGQLALCYMKESLGTNASFAKFPVARDPLAADHGENRLADMPSIIVELGFHTNAEDAAAIQNYVFQGLATRGLEKAYRMFKEGNGCETFSATYSEVTVVSDSTRDAEIVFGGFPRFPVKYTSTVAECPSGILCVSLGGRFATAETPRTITHSCSSSQPMTMKWNVTFTDADGVKAEALSTVHCQPKA